MMLTKMVDSTSPDAPDYQVCSFVSVSKVGCMLTLTNTPQSLISALSIMRETSKFVSTRLGNADTRSKVLEIERRVRSPLSLLGDWASIDCCLSLLMGGYSTYA